MAKIKLKGAGGGFPMPVTLVGYESSGKPNFVAATWVMRANQEPPMVAIAPGSRGRGFDIGGIVQKGAFSVNLPGIGLIEKTDYCALNPGEDVDKSGLFDIFCGELSGAPMIEQCPLCMECKLVQRITLPSHTLYIGEIVGLYAEEDVFFGGCPDAGLWRPFLLTRPDDLYWEVGARVGDAWSIGHNCGKGAGQETPESLVKRLEDTQPGVSLPEEPQSGTSWLKSYGAPLASSKEWAASFMKAELERAVPEGWRVQPVEKEPLAWLIVPAAIEPGGWADTEYGVRVSPGLDQVQFTCENNDIGPLDLHNFLLNGMVVDAAALRHYGVSACLQYVMSHHKPNKWGYT